MTKISPQQMKNLPPELLSQLKCIRNSTFAGKRQKQVTEALKKLEEADLDEILIHIYKRNGGIVKKKHASAIYRKAYESQYC